MYGNELERINILSFLWAEWQEPEETKGVRWIFLILRLFDPIHNQQAIKDKC